MNSEKMQFILLKMIVEDRRSFNETKDCLEKLKSEGYDVSFDVVNGFLERLQREGLIRVQHIWGDDILINGPTAEGELRVKYNESTKPSTGTNVQFHGSVNAQNISSGDYNVQNVINNNDTSKELLNALDALISHPEVPPQLLGETVKLKNEIENRNQFDNKKLKEYIGDYLVNLGASATTSMLDMVKSPLVNFLVSLG